MRLPKNRAPTSPGEMLQEEFLSPLELSQAELARLMKVSQSGISDLIAGKRSVTADTAIRLGKVLGTTPDLWLNLQLKLDVWNAQNSMGDLLSEIQPYRRVG